MFRSIWGDTVEVTFTVTAGHLEIDIVAVALESNPFVARRIVSNAYTFFNINASTGDVIEFRTERGLRTQAQVDSLLSELSPAGVFVESDLTVT